MPEIRNHKNDLPDLFHYNNVKAIAIDTETAGLHLQRDRLCVVQISPGDGSADIMTSAVCAACEFTSSLRGCNRHHLTLAQCLTCLHLFPSCPGHHRYSTCLTLRIQDD